MSRTYRKPSHRIKKYKKLKQVRDGTRTRVSHFCECNGGCSYCLGNRMHKHDKQPSLLDALNEVFLD